MRYIFLSLTLLGLSSCAVGAGGAAASVISGYSLRSGEANRLSHEAENSLVYRIKRELTRDEDEDEYDRR